MVPSLTGSAVEDDGPLNPGPPGTAGQNEDCRSQGDEGVTIPGAQHGVGPQNTKGENGPGGDQPPARGEINSCRPDCRRRGGSGSGGESCPWLPGRRSGLRSGRRDALRDELTEPSPSRNIQPPVCRLVKPSRVQSPRAGRVGVGMLIPAGPAFETTRTGRESNQTTPRPVLRHPSRAQPTRMVLLVPSGICWMAMPAGLLLNGPAGHRRG